jgi:hypothetical protein
MGSATRYNLADIPGFSALNLLRSKFDRGQACMFRNSTLFPQLSSKLQDLVLDIGSFSWLLNAGTSRGTKLDGYTFHDTLLLIGYRLVDIGPLGGPRTTNCLENMVQLGLFSLLAVFMRKLGGDLPTFPLLAELTRSAVQGHLDEDEDSQAMLLWVMLIGRVTIFVESDDIWLIPKVQCTASALGLETWEALRRAISKYPWINAVHDKPGQALWALSTPNHDTRSTTPDSTASKFPGSLTKSEFQNL